MYLVDDYWIRTGVVERNPYLNSHRVADGSVLLALTLT
jgi:hypothetical protein